MITLSVCLGGLGCRLTLPEAIAAPLALRYRGYESSEAPAPMIHCTARVEPGSVTR